MVKEMGYVRKTVNSRYTPKAQQKIGDKRVLKKSNTRQADQLGYVQNRCTLCNFVTFYPNNLKRHIQLKHKKPKLTAKQQKQSNSYAVQFIKKLFTCTLCKYSSKERFGLQRHGKLRHGLLVGKLDCCGRRFENDRALKQHIMSYHFECPKGNFDQHTSSSKRKQTVKFDSNERNRKNFVKMHESDEETSSSSSSTHQLFQRAGSFIRIYLRETGNTIMEEENAVQTSNTNRLRTTPVRGDKLHTDDLAVNGEKRSSKRIKDKKDSEAGFRENIVDKRNRSRYSLRQQNDHSSETILKIKKEKVAKNANPVCAVVEQHLLDRSPTLKLRQSDRMTEQKTPHLKQLPHNQSNSASQSHLLFNNINDEARKWRLQISLIKNTSALTTLLERLLEMLASIKNRIHEATEFEIRFRAIESFEYVWNTSKIVIVRWGHLNTSSDPFFNAVQYAYGTLPVFIDWERKEHLDMLDNGILLSLCTVRNWEPPPSCR